MDDLSRYEAIHQIGLAMIFFLGDLRTQLRSCMFLLLHMQCSHGAPSVIVQNFPVFLFDECTFFWNIMCRTNVCCQGLSPKKREGWQVAKIASRDITSMIEMISCDAIFERNRPRVHKSCAPRLDCVHQFGVFFVSTFGQK